MPELREALHIVVRLLSGGLVAVLLVGMLAQIARFYWNERAHYRRHPVGLFPLSGSHAAKNHASALVGNGEVGERARRLEQQALERIEAGGDKEPQ